MHPRGTSPQRSPRPKSIRMMLFSIVSGIAFVTLLACRGILSPGVAAPATQSTTGVKQPRRGLSVSVTDNGSSDASFRLPSNQNISMTLMSALSQHVEVEATMDPPPRWSSVQSLHHSPLQRNDTLPHGKNTGAYSYFHIFENVQLTWVGKDEIGVSFYHPSNETIPDTRRIEPKTFRPEYGKELRISVQYHARQPDQENELSRCRNWVNIPAIAWHFPYPDNLFHFLNDGFVPVLHTLLDTGLRPAHVDRMINEPVVANSTQCILPTPVPTEVELIAMRPDAYHQPWSFLMDHITTQQSTLRQRNYHCFKKLVVGASFLLDLFDQGFKNDTLTLRKPALEAVHRSMITSALTNKVALAPPHMDHAALASEGCSRIADIRSQQAANVTASSSGRKWHSGGDLAQITLAARSAPESRSIINEADLLRYLEAHWEVRVVSSSFNDTLYDTIDLLQRSDVFLGMHGAGFTNIQFIPKDAVVVQLMPYGWNVTRPEDKAEHVVRAELYKQITEILNVPHFYHINDNPKHAFFRQKDFDSVNASDHFCQHPDAQMSHPVTLEDTDNPPAWWIYQDTFVDLSEGSSMLAVIGRALSERGIRRRDPPLPFSAKTQLPPDKEVTKQPVKVIEGAKDQIPTEVKKVEAALDKAPTEAKAPAPAEERWTGIMVR